MLSSFLPYFHGVPAAFFDDSHIMRIQRLQSWSQILGFSGIFRDDLQIMETPPKPMPIPSMYGIFR